MRAFLPHGRLNRAVTDELPRLHVLRRIMVADAPAAPVVGQTRAWEDLKRQYPRFYRRELAFAEEGPRAATYGWPA